MDSPQSRLQWQGRHEPEPPRAFPVKRLCQHACAPDLEAPEGWPEAWPGEGMLFHGDNAEVLSHLLATGFAGRVQLVYIDPPFGSGADYARKLWLRGGGAIDLGKSLQYTDTFSTDHYLQFIYERLVLLKALLSETGNLVLHADEHKGHLLRALLDEVFGPERFVNEIIWHYPDNFQGNVRGLPHNHNALYWYSKTEKYFSQPVMIPLDKPVKRDRRVWSKALGRVVSARDEEGRILYDTYTEKKADDVWRIGQSSVSKTRSGEFLGYPTQKPEALLSRVIQAASQPGELVLDAFAGSGTTAAVAQKMGRNWISCDSNYGSIQTTAVRIRQVIEDPAFSEGVARRFRVLALGQAERRQPEPPPQARVRARLDEDALHVDLLDYKAPALLARSPKGGQVEDWRALVDCVQVDPDFDGEVFQPVLCDRPTRLADFVQGSYQLEAPAEGATVAVRILDLMGGEVTWTGQVSR